MSASNIHTLLLDTRIGKCNNVFINKIECTTLVKTEEVYKCEYTNAKSDTRK